MGFRVVIGHTLMTNSSSPAFCRISILLLWCSLSQQTSPSRWNRCFLPLPWQLASQPETGSRVVYETNLPWQKLSAWGELRVCTQGGLGGVFVYFGLRPSCAPLGSSCSCTACVCVRVCLRAWDFMFVLLVGSAQGFLYLAAVGTLPSSYGLWMRITVTFASGQRQTAPVFPLWNSNKCINTDGIKQRPMRAIKRVRHTSHAVSLPIVVIAPRKKGGSRANEMPAG